MLRAALLLLLLLPQRASPPWSALFEIAGPRPPVAALAISTRRFAPQAGPGAAQAKNSRATRQLSGVADQRAAPPRPALLEIAGLRPGLAALAAQEAPDLAQEIEKLVSASGLKDPKIGILVHSASADRMLHKGAADQKYLLASNTKLLTCAAALDRLGPDYKFFTEIHAERLVDGAAAALVVTGNGDPHISGRDFEDNPCAVFEKFAAALKEKGVRRIDGPVKLVADLGYDGPIQPGWKKYAGDQWWAAPFGQFSLNDNCIDVKYSAGEKEGDPARLSIAPDTNYVTIRNESKTIQGKAKAPFQVSRKPGSNEVLAQGELPLGSRGSTAWVAIHDPQRFFGAVLKETLQRSGIEVAGEVEIVEKAPEGLASVARHESGLARVLQVCLTVSQNFYAEMLLLHLGRKFHGKGSRENGLKVVREFLTGAGVEGVSQLDGSGLTRENEASPEALLALLKHMRGHKHAKAWYDALAVNGAKVGTLRRRMREKRYAGRIHAKTGHIDGVSTLSGYAEAESGDTLIFSILVNIPQGQSTTPADRLQDRICELLVRWK